MRLITWISRDAAVAAHRRHLAQFGGQDGVSNEDALAAVVDGPRARFEPAMNGLHEKLPAVAAEYACAVLRTRPFYDRNSRTAYVLCRMFLMLNGFDLVGRLDEQCLMFIRLAAGGVTEEDFTAWVVTNSSRA